MKIKPLKESDVTFRIEVLGEHASYEGNAMASGDEAVDREAEDWIRQQLESGNEWAWCSVHVVAEYETEDGHTFEGDDYLGCCSYLGEADFKADGYWEDMKERALEDLNENIKLAMRSLAPLIDCECAHE